MNDVIVKHKIMEYAEKLLSPMLAENLEYCESIEDEEGTTNIWLLETDNGEEYWVLEGVYPSDLYKKGGIYQDVAQVFATYKEMQQGQDEELGTPDRFQLYQ